MSAMEPIKRLMVRVLGRRRATTLSTPYHDWRAARRTAKFLASLPAHDLHVNLGCGLNRLDGWVNVDRARNEQTDVVWDLRRGLPFPAESCTAVFAEHVIEHLSKEDAQSLLLECFRVLQKEGIVRLSTPDARRYLRSYAEDGEFLKHSSFEKPCETPMDRVNQMMREDGQHLWAYDAESLVYSLTKAGFTKVVEQSAGNSLHSDMQNIDMEARAFESLYVEAVKS